MMRTKIKSRWQLFRERVIELDGAKCCRCGRSATDGAVLQVHHKKYVAGRKPWEYKDGECETLCKGCHAAEHGIIPPKVGWVYAGEEDLGELLGTCEYCNNNIRHVFYIEHPHWPPLEVGTVCCDNLTNTELASNHIESLQRFVDRKKRFVSSPRWQSTHDGLQIQQKGILVAVYPSNDSFRIHMDNHIGKQLFATQDEAKEAAFEVIESGKAESYLSSRRARRLG